MGLWARASGIGTAPMWLDEAYSAYAASKGWHFLWTVVPRYETHPPFYYSLLRGWTLLAGDGLVAHRLLGLVFGVAAMPVIALAAHRLATLVGTARMPATLAAFALAGVSPVLVWMSREVRPYPLMILVYATAIVALFAVAGRRREGSPLAGRGFAVYLGCQALLLWLHNLGPLYVAALGCALLCVARVTAMRRTDWLWFVAGHVIVLALWLPALFILLDQAPEWVRATWLKFGTKGLWLRATMMFTGPGADARVAAGLLALSGGALLWRARDGRRLLAALLLLALLPLGLSLIISATIAPVFIIRTMTPLAVPAILLFAIGLGWRRPRWLRLIALAPMFWLIGTQGWSDIHQRRQSEGDWYRALSWLQPRFRPGDIVFAYPNEGALPFDRAVRDKGLALPSRPIPTAVPTLSPPPGSWYVSGSRGVPSLDRRQLRNIAEASETRAIPTIWLLRLGPWAYDKGDVFLEELSRERTDVGRYRDRAIDIRGLRSSPARGGGPRSGGGGERPDAR